MSDDATHWYGCDSVHPDCHHPAERILLDLIADLVGDGGDGHELTPGEGCGSCMVCEYIDRAEARLRAVTHELAEVAARRRPDCQEDYLWP